jgi:membrane-associated phospholipid phosphatase
MSSNQNMRDERTDHGGEVRRELTPRSKALRFWRGRTIRRVATLIALAVTLTLLWSRLSPSSRSSLVGSLIANRTLVVLLCSFALIALSLLWAVGQRLDVRVLTTLNLRGHHSTRMDRLMWVCTQVGSARVSTVLVAVSYVLGARRFAIELALGSLTLALLVTIIKILTDRARPFRILGETRVIGRRERGLSFPSGHTTQVFFMMTIIIRYARLPLAAALGLYVVAGLVGYTRIYLGVHYPRDVVAGAILGLIWGGLSLLVATYL